MQIVVRATDPSGKPVATQPLTKKNAIMKIWEFKTSGYTEIRTFDAATNERVNILAKMD